MPVTLSVRLVLAGLGGVLVASCGSHPEWDNYTRLVQMSVAGRMDAVSRLDAAKQVDLYLYASTQVRPSDYSFAEAIHRDRPDVVEELGRRLKDSNSEAEAFALVYALHGASAAVLARSPAVAANAAGACDPQFKAPSPCHQLLADLLSRAGAANKK